MTDDLTPDEREHYAREMLKNPLYTIFMEKLEQDAMNRAVSASPTDHLAQQAALAEVRAARSFRQHCEALLRNKHVPKAAPA